MSPLDFLALLGMVATPAAVLFGVAWWNTRRELELRKELTRPATERVVSDTGRLEQAIDAIALEVERMTEGQRFVTKLLAERAANERGVLPAPPSQSPHVITPH